MSLEDHEKRHPELAKDLASTFGARCFAALNMTVSEVLVPNRRWAPLGSERLLIRETAQRRMGCAWRRVVSRVIRLEGGAEVGGGFVGLGVVDEGGDEGAVAGVVEGNVFAGGGGEEGVVVGAADFGGGGDELLARLVDAGGDGEGAADGGGFLEAGDELAADAEAFAGPGGGPDHGFVEDGGEEPAVDDPFEADVVVGGGEVGGDGAGVGVDVEGEVEAVGVGAAADEAVGGVGEFELGHGREVMRERQKVKGKRRKVGLV